MTLTYGPDETLESASTPTMYFVGVTTAQSSIRPVFEKWMHILKRPDVRLVGIDLPLRADPAEYRRVVAFMRNDPQSLGALVTTHKVQLYMACMDMFDQVDDAAATLHEVSCLSKREGEFRASAKDPLTSAYALDAFVPRDHWVDYDHAEVVCLGAGGSALALASHFAKTVTERPGPRRLVVTNRSANRLDEFRKAYASLGRGPELELVHATSAEVNDALVGEAAAGSLIINATGLGKDAPGSPLTWDAKFPEHAFVWDFNYRGDLIFLQQAQAQQESQSLQVEDGWVYFLHGWTQVIAEVLNIDIPPSGPLFDELASAAKAVRLGN